MLKKKITNLDATLYYEKLDNGLEIYMVPDKRNKTIYAKYTTKFGSEIIEFNVNGQDVKVPIGVAHFLEHQLFEQGDGTSAMDLFSKSGTSSNAFTNNAQTTYLFQGPQQFKKNLKALLDFVNNPHYTDDSIEKEKGIIIQEYKMYEDSPNMILFYKMLENTFSKHPIRYRTVGNVESINKITKKDLDACYDTFYNPSNMFLVITGNIKPKEVVELVKENFNKKSKKLKIVTKDYDEPDKVVKKSEIVDKNLGLKRMSYGIKLNTTNYDKDKLRKYISIYLDSLFGDTSIFMEEAINEGIIISGSSTLRIATDRHDLIGVSFFPMDEEKLLEKIKKTFKMFPSKEEFERKKRVFLSDTIMMFDNAEDINSFINRRVATEDVFDTDLYQKIKDLNYEEFKEMITSLDFSNSLYVILK